MDNPDNRPADSERGDSNEPEAYDGSVPQQQSSSANEPSFETGSVAAGTPMPDAHQPQQYPGFPEQYPDQRYPGQPQYPSFSPQNPDQHYVDQQYSGQQYPDLPYSDVPYPVQQYAGSPQEQYPTQEYAGQQQNPGQYQEPTFAGQHDQNATPETAQYETGQYETGQYATGQHETGQHENAQFQDQQYASPVTTQPGTSRAPAAAKTRRPRTDANGVAYGVGRFSVREVVVIILAGLVFIASFLPFIGGIYADLFGYSSLWAPAPWLAIPGTLLLAAAGTLIVIRRLRPDLRLRVGSLSVDQFASVAAVSTAGFYVGALFLLLGFSAWFGSGSFGGGALSDRLDVFQPGAGLILGLLFSLASIVPTVCARFIPVFAEDFSARPEIAAHPAARNAVPVPVRPRPVRPETVPQPEVHQYGREHSGSVQLTPADTRPEDFAAYRRSGWSPESTRATVDAEQQSVVFEGSSEAETASEAGMNTLATPDFSSATSTGTVTGFETERGSGESVLGDEIDELHTGDEPAPVSAIRHVAEQESLADDSERELLGGSATVTDEPDVALDAVSTDPATASDPDTGSGSPATPAVVSTQPFWVYSRVTLPVVDEKTGEMVFDIGPGAWALAIVDRGSELVIRHDDGRVGVLRSLSGVMRG